MADINEKFINVLTENSEGVTKSAVINVMLNSLLSKYKCVNSREGFLIALQNGNRKNKDKFSEEYMNCHNQALEISQSSCANKYVAAQKCLESQSSLKGVSSECVGSLEDLIQCVNNH